MKLFSESIGAGTSSNTSIASYTGWQNQGTLTFTSSGTAVQTGQANQSITSAYAAASGGGLLFFGTATTNTRELTISGINTTGFTNLSVVTGIRNENAAGGLTVQYSTDGSNYTTLDVLTPSTMNTWYEMSTSGAGGQALPATNNLRLRFTKNSTAQFRLDDIRITGTPSTPTITSVSPTSVASGGGNFTLTVNGSNFVQGTPTGAKSVVKVNGVNMTTTFVNTGQLTAAVPANAILNAGSLPVVVSITDGTNSVNSASTSLLVTGKPSVTTVSATVTEGTDVVVLLGSSDANGFTTSANFEYGPDNTYGSSVLASPGSYASQGQNLRQVLTGLDPNVTFHYRA
ncbi:MAG: hypothetical protein EOP50_06990, partial [Sphingobacteriales bacterium]